MLLPNDCEMPRFEFPDKLEVAEVNEPRAGFWVTWVVPARGPDPVVDAIPDCPDENTVWAAGAEDAIPLDITFDI